MGRIDPYAYPSWCHSMDIRPSRTAETPIPSATVSKRYGVKVVATGSRPAPSRSTAGQRPSFLLIPTASDALPRVPVATKSPLDLGGGPCSLAGAFPRPTRNPPAESVAGVAALFRFRGQDRLENETGYTAAGTSDELIACRRDQEPRGHSPTRYGKTIKIPTSPVVHSNRSAQRDRPELRCPHEDRRPFGTPFVPKGFVVLEVCRDQSRWAPGLPFSTANEANVDSGASGVLTVLTIRRSAVNWSRSTWQRT